MDCCNAPMFILYNRHSISSHMMMIMMMMKQRKSKSLGRICRVSGQQRSVKTVWCWVWSSKIGLAVDRQEVGPMISQIDAAARHHASGNRQERTKNHWP